MKPLHKQDSYQHVTQRTDPINFMSYTPLDSLNQATKSTYHTILKNTKNSFFPFTKKEMYSKITPLVPYSHHGNRENKVVIKCQSMFVNCANVNKTLEALSWFISDNNHTSLQPDLYKPQRI